jgi:23S rRNA pseudouridine1911/1915/1917 synthase
VVDLPHDISEQGFLELGRQAPLEILYEDSVLIAVNKPSGLLFHGYTQGLPTSLADQVKAYIAQQKNKQGAVYLGISHRLDRPVSGVALFTRNSKAAGRIGEQFQSRSVQKWYLGLVQGVPPAPEATLEDELPVPSSDPEAKQVSKFCRLRYRQLWEGEGQSLLAIALETGRRHQIRMQLAKRGLVLHGDLEYGASEVFLGSEAVDRRFRPIALHAAFLSVLHPISYEEQRIVAALPRTWQRFSPIMLEKANAFLAG